MPLLPKLSVRDIRRTGYNSYNSLVNEDTFKPAGRARTCFKWSRRTKARCGWPSEILGLG